MIDEAMQRLLGYDRRRYWLVNGWSIRFRVGQVLRTAYRPHGIKYSFTLHDSKRKTLISKGGIRRILTMTRKSLAELREEMRGVARGARAPAPLPAAPLLALLTPEAIELMGTLLREHPRNVRELTALTGRAQPNISRSLQLLARHGLVRLVRDGRDVRPEPIATEVRVDLATGTYETKAALA